jgi:hypothetical protein
MAKRLSKPSVKINNGPIAIIPNSFKKTLGKGETIVETASLGGDATEILISDSVEDKIGLASFDIPVTADNIKKVKGWKNNPGVNAIRSSEDSYRGVMTQASLTNDPEMTFSSEGNMTCEWKGRPWQ